MTVMRSSWSQQGIPNPGSEAARTHGCLCPWWDNARGRGFEVDHELCFWIVAGCPLHAPIEDTAPL